MVKKRGEEESVVVTVFAVLAQKKIKEEAHAVAAAAGLWWSMRIPCFLLWLGTTSYTYTRT